MIRCWEGESLAMQAHIASRISGSAEASSDRPRRESSSCARAVRSRTADPIAVSTTIRTRTWQGLFGDFGFTSEGDVTGRDVSIKRMHNGQFVTVRTIREDVH